MGIDKEFEGGVREFEENEGFKRVIRGNFFN